MAEQHSPAIYALMKLHAELGGRIMDNRREAVKLRADMRHVEAVMHLLEPGFNARTIVPRRRNTINPWFKRGTIMRAALAAMRETGEPMSAEEIAVALLRSKGIVEPTKDQRRRMYSAVESSLRNHEGKTVAGDEGRPRRWWLLIK